MSHLFTANTIRQINRTQVAVIGNP